MWDSLVYFCRWEKSKNKSLDAKLAKGTKFRKGYEISLEGGVETSLFAQSNP